MTVPGRPAAGRVDIAEGIVAFVGTAGSVGAACIVSPGIPGIVNRNTENLDIAGPRIVDRACTIQLCPLHTPRHMSAADAAHERSVVAASHNRLLQPNAIGVEVDEVEEGVVVVVPASTLSHHPGTDKVVELASGAARIGRASQGQNVLVAELDPTLCRDCSTQ